MQGKSRFSKASSRIGKREKTKKKLKNILRVGVPTLLVVLFVFVSRLDSLQVSNINVLGAVAVSGDDVKNATLESLEGNYLYLIPKSNILFFKKDALASVIKSEFPTIKDLNIEREIDGSVNIKVLERLPDFVWCNSGVGCFLMSKDGMIFAESTADDIANKIIFKGVLSDNPITKTLDSGERMQIYEETIDTLSESDINVKEVNIESSLKVTFKSDMGDIILNPEDKNIKESVQNAILLIEDTKVKKKDTKFEYIDARYGSKLFYKTY